MEAQRPKITNTEEMFRTYRVSKKSKLIEKIALRYFSNRTCFMGNPDHKKRRNLIFDFRATKAFRHHLNYFKSDTESHVFR